MRKIVIELPQNPDGTPCFADIFWTEDKGDEIRYCVRSSREDELRDSLKGMLESYQYVIEWMNLHNFDGERIASKLFAGEIERAERLTK